MWNVGVGVNDRLEQGVGFSWALLRNEFFSWRGIGYSMVRKARVS